MPPQQSSQEVLCDPLRQKFVDILKSNGICDEVGDITMREPPELKGEHMAAITVYVKVDFKDDNVKPINLFVKKFSDNEAHAKFIKDMKIMEKETSFFNDFLPKIREFCKKNEGCEKFMDFFPVCLYGDDEMIVLENVVLNDGFIMLSKEEKQDLFTAKYVLENLAKFHASSFAFMKKEFGGFEGFKKEFELNCLECFVNEGNPMISQMFENGINTCINVLKGHPVEGHAEASEKLANFRGKAYPLVFEMLRHDGKYKDDKLKVLNHGDCWNNNMLFKMDKNTGKVNDHIFVDLQITRLGSPCLDLGYFLFTSVKPPVRRAHLKDLLAHYYNHLDKSLKLFGEKCPLSFEEFLRDYKVKSEMGFFFNLSILAAIGAFKEMDLENMGSDPDQMMAAFQECIDKWIANHPEEAEEISKEIVAVVDEHEKFQQE